MKQRTILLVSPWIHDFAAYDLWIRPLGILRIGRLLIEGGHRVFLLDLLNHGPVPGPPGNRGNRIKRLASGKGAFYREILPKPPAYKHIPRYYSRYGLPPRHAARLLDTLPRPEAVMVTSYMTYWYPGVRETISFIKGRFPGVPVILGGIYPTLCPEHAREASGADHVISGRVIGNPDRLAGIPVLEECLSDHRRWNNPWPLPALELYGSLEGLPLAATSGCPHRCPFCSSALLSGEFSARDSGDAAAEILHWHTTMGARHFAFFDDALLANTSEHFLPLAQAVSAFRLPLTFHAPNGLAVEAIDGPVARAMKSMGVATIRLSLESAGDENPAIFGHKASREQFLRAMSNLEAAGYRRDEIGAYLLAGLPGQPAQEVAESIRWVLKHGARPYLAFYAPIPGTGLWEESVRRSPYPLDEDPLYHNNSIFPCGWDGFNASHVPALKALMYQGTRYA